MGRVRIRKCFFAFCQETAENFYISGKYAPAPGGTQHVVFLLVLVIRSLILRLSKGHPSYGLLIEARKRIAMFNGIWDPSGLIYGRNAH